MKKILAVILSIIILTGCSSSSDTPTKKVEKYLSNYQTLSEDVLKDLDDVVDRENDFNKEQKTKYKEIMKNHYKNLKYEIKDEIIDGDSATVTTEIEVTDYSKIIKEAEAYKESNPSEFNDSDGVYDITLFNNYRLDKIKDAKETVKYTIDFTLSKEGNEWIINPLSDIDESKILGIYEY